MSRRAAWQPPEWLAPLRASLPALGPAGAGSVEQAPRSVRDYLLRYDLHIADPAVHQALGWVSSGNCTLAVHRFQRADASANLVLVHGYFDHSGLYGSLLRYALSRRCNVLLFDLPGHGISAGERAVIADFSLYRQALLDVRRAACLPDLPWLAVAQSTGGSATIDALMQAEEDWTAVVLLAPLVRIHHWYRVCAAHTLLRPWLARLPRQFTRNSGDDDFLARHRADPLQHPWVELRWLDALRRWVAQLPQGPVPAAPPLLVVQGTADATVDWRYNLRRVAQWFPAHQQLLLPGARHHLANETAALRCQYQARMDDFLGFAASAGD